MKALSRLITVTSRAIPFIHYFHCSHLPQSEIMLPGCHCYSQSWRQRHDDVKVALVERAHPAHIKCFGEFLHLIPAGALQEGGESKKLRAINVPDLRYRLPTPPAPNAHHPRRAKGQTPQLLAELICINAGSTWYPRRSREKAGDRRALVKLNQLDRQNHKNMAVRLAIFPKRATE